MANITRFDPFGELDDLLQGFFIRPMSLESREPARFRMDVKEDEQKYTVLAELPGVKKDDIQVTINGNQVAIAAEVKKNGEEKQNEKVLRRERYYGKLFRAFSLGQEVDEAAASARFVDGVLELTLPKRTASSGRRLTIS
ncbi:Hsp20/alpha crystallin family protein [Pelomicrobium sp.]|jgi:HSP20 family protein|uniref:Hsp20/alpha crystallin family protein n=1 Tax=Pelomicrobium sp. TaxID=2815319 RepID=UPI002FDE9067